MPPGRSRRVGLARIGRGRARLRRPSSRPTSGTLGSVTRRRGGTSCAPRSGVRTLVGGQQAAPPDTRHSANSGFRVRRRGGTSRAPRPNPEGGRRTPAPTPGMSGRGRGSAGCSNPPEADKKVQMQGGARGRGTHRRWVGGILWVRRSERASAPTRQMGLFQQPDQAGASFEATMRYKFGSSRYSTTTRPWGARAAANVSRVG